METTKSYEDLFEAVDNVNIDHISPLISASILLEDLPIDSDVASLVKKTRKEVQDIIDGKDDRLVIVVGPCSIHHATAAIDYAKRLIELKRKHSQELVVIMRTYFEKPRTTVGWKGLVNDPFMNGSFQINKGLRIGRRLLLDLNRLGLPVATEFLDTITPQFFGDLISYGAIGARTTESQVHRELASGLSCPIGFKNGTSGNIGVAVNAFKSSSRPHRFLSVTKHSIAGIVTTKGNQGCHIILRGGTEGPNYYAENVKGCKKLLEKEGICTSKIVIDCSHGNSNKDHKNQPKVAENVAAQVSGGEKAIIGLMIESNINQGNQKLDTSQFKNGEDALKSLKYGVSITDACIDFETTETVLENLALAVRAKRRFVRH